MREETLDKLKLSYEVEPFVFQSRFWGAVAIRRKARLEAAITLSKRFRLKYFTDLGFVVNYKDDCYEIIVIDDNTVVIERYGKLIEMSIDTLVNIIDGKQSDKVLREMEVDACEINHG